MKQFKRVNNIAGWAVFAFALLVYSATMERTASFWDCGEFISAAVKLEVVHPPGAPLHAMVGKLFTLFTPDDLDAASINFLSALTSALTVLMFFWSITMLGLRLYEKQGIELTQPNLLVLIGGGVVGGMAITFLDSFWFSAVEGEVYAISAFFSAAILWCMLKWERQADDPRSNRWLVLIALLVGLGSGVHLLHLLALPAVAFIYYFRKYTTATPRGIIATFVIGSALVGFVLLGVLDWWLRIGAWLDRVFVNDFGLPFYTGFFFFAAVFFAAAVWLLLRATRKRQPILQLAMLGGMMVVIGSASFPMVVIRANTNPPINMNNAGDLSLLHAYLKREQYGQRPLFFGPQFTASPLYTDSAGSRWMRGTDDQGKEKYIRIGTKVKYVFEDDGFLARRGFGQAEVDFINQRNKPVLLPRMGHWQDAGHERAYRDWLGLEDSEMPSYFDNIRFLFQYQFGYMYWRYLMWNFSGKQDDIQGHIQRGGRNGNWMTGFDFIDKNRVDGYDNYESRVSKARNKFYMIPFALALIGMFYHFKHERKGAWIIMIYFLFMGLGNLINSNEPPYEPRERDYAVALSFCAFAMWIGFAAPAIYHRIKRKNAGMIGATASIAITLLAPVLMGVGGWDDHDRSNQRLARAAAIGYLESCEPNAILFTQGDNDTYPLWYVQEVEGIRNDVRVVNLSLLAVDWYINQLRNKVNNNDAWRLSFDERSIRGENRTQIGIKDNPNYISRYGTDLSTALGFVRTGPKTEIRGYQLHYIPTKKVTVPVDTARIRAEGWVRPTDRLQPFIEFELPGNTLIKDELIILDILASNKWERPIYFAATVTGSKLLGLDKYLRSEGLAKRIVPVANVKTDPDLNYGHVMGKWEWGNLDKKKMHLQETGLRTAMMLRTSILREVVDPLFDDAANLESAALTAADSMTRVELLQRAEERRALAMRVLDTTLIVIPPHNVPITEPAEAYNYVRLYYMNGNPARAYDQALHLMMLIEEDMQHLALNRLISEKRAETGGEVIMQYLQSESDPRKWPMPVRNLHEDMSIIGSVIRMAQQHGDSAQAETISRRYQSLQDATGLFDPYMRSRRGPTR